MLDSFSHIVFYLFAFVSPFSITGSTILLTVILLLYLFNIKSRIKDSPSDFLYFVVFYLWRGLSVVLNGYPMLFLKAFGDIWDKLPYFVSSGFHFDKKRVERFIYLLLIANVVIFLYAMLQKYLGFPIIVKQLFTDDWVRFKGYHSHPLRFAGYLSTVFIISFAFGVFYSKRYLYFSYILIIAIILNGSRSYWFGVFSVVFLMSFFHSFKKMVYHFIFLSILLMISMWFFPDILKRAESSFSRLDGSFSHMSLRRNFWIAGIEVFQGSPIYGVGAKMSSLYLEKYKNIGLVDNTAHFHNLYITNLAEGGIIGGGILIFLCAYFIRKYFILAKTSKDGFSKAFAFSILGCWVNVVLAGFFESNFSTFSLWSLLTLWMGLYEGFRKSAA